jgi:serine/threonine protein phosphatase PrpC
MCSLVFAGRSDTGRQRSSNQDRWGADAGQCVYMVADGVATSSNGALAAELVTELLPAYLQRHLSADHRGDPDAAKRVLDAVAQLSDDLHAHGRTDPRVAGASTTVVAAVVTDCLALIAHLGDSRAYLFRDKRLQRLTCDHTLFQALIDAGEVTGEEAAEHPARHTLTRHVAMTPPALPDVSAVDLQVGDRLLLCSDGLHGVVDEARLVEILGEHSGPDDACDALIDAANAAGGPDNVTAVVIDITNVASARA